MNAVGRRIADGDEEEAKPLPGMTGAPGFLDAIFRQSLVGRQQQLQVSPCILGLAKAPVQTPKNAKQRNGRGVLVVLVVCVGGEGGDANRHRVRPHESTVHDVSFIL